MSAVFTSPAGASWQTLLNEITLAYSERRQVLGQSAYIPVAGRNVQQASYWRTFQEWIEENYINFINHLLSKGEFRSFTLESFATAAGLNFHTEDDPRLWRRYAPAYGEWNGTTTPEWEYGQIQAGDVIGSWIFEDLQKAFSTCRWTNITKDLEAPVITEPVGCNYSELSTDVQILLENIPVNVELSAFPYCRVDDYLEINGVKFNSLDLIEDGDTGCENGVIGWRLYKTDVSFGSFKKGTTIQGRVWDTKRETSYISGGAVAIWDFANI